MTPGKQEFISEVVRAVVGGKRDKKFRRIDLRLGLGREPQLANASKQPRTVSRRLMFYFDNA